MPRSHPLHLQTLIALCGTSFVMAQPPSPAAATRSQTLETPARVAPEHRNAAIKYLTLAMEMPRELTEKVAAVNYDACGVTLESIKNDPAAAAALAALESYDIAPWIKASSLAKYDLELATEEGFNLLMPHLGKMRSAARLVRWSARVALAQDRPEQAAERLAALTRMSRHVTQDRILISSLVGVAISAIAFDEMRTLAAGGTLTASARDSLVATLESFDPADPFLMRAALRGERGWGLQGTLAAFSGPDAGAAFIDSILQGSDQNDATRVRAKVISEWDTPRLTREIGRLDDAYDALELAWDSADPKTELERLETRVNAEEFGPLVALLFPSTGRAHAASERAKKDLETTLEALREAKVSEPSPAPR
jgi:hypothetical protein